LEEHTELAIVESRGFRVILHWNMCKKNIVHKGKGKGKGYTAISASEGS